MSVLRTVFLRLLEHQRVAVNLLNIKRKQQNHNSPPLSTKPSSMSLLPEPPSTPSLPQQSRERAQQQRKLDSYLNYKYCHQVLMS